MLLQKLIHSQDDILTDNGTNKIITHGVDEISLGGEFTICGRAIVDSAISFEGWEAVGESFIGSIKKCECKNCIKTIRYFKSLR